MLKNIKLILTIVLYLISYYFIFNAIALVPGGMICRFLVGYFLVYRLNEAFFETLSKQREV